MKIKVVFALFLAFIAFGCSADQYEKYLGYWKLNDTPHPQVMQITKDGKTYLLDQNVLHDTDMRGNTKKPFALTPQGDQLTLNNGFGSTTIALSNNSTALHLSDLEYTKISQAEYKLVEAHIAEKEQKRGEQLRRCNALNQEYKDANQQLSFTERNDNGAALVASFQAKAEDIPDCRVNRGW